MRRDGERWRETERRGEARRSAARVGYTGRGFFVFGMGRGTRRQERERRGGERREEEEDTERRGNTEDIEDGMYVVRRAGAAYVTVYTA